MKLRLTDIYVNRHLKCLSCNPRAIQCYEYILNINYMLGTMQGKLSAYGTLYSSPDTPSHDFEGLLKIQIFLLRLGKPLCMLSLGTVCGSRLSLIPRLVSGLKTHHRVEGERLHYSSQEKSILLSMPHFERHTQTLGSPGGPKALQYL